MDVLKFFCTMLLVGAEQVIAVPKITLQDQIPQRTALLEPQLAEQLVEVPTVVSQSFFQQLFADQNVDIPVPSARGLLDGGGLQGFSPGRCSTAPLGADLAGLQDFSQGQGSTALLDAPQEHFQWLFSHFSTGQKKCEGCRALERTRAHPCRQPLPGPLGLTTTMRLGCWLVTRRTARSG